MKPWTAEQERELLDLIAEGQRRRFGRVCLDYPSRVRVMLDAAFSEAGGSFKKARETARQYAASDRRTL